jgi:tetratricopeptide (TPR) repeat protein/tRNA A-37 threonylcarbamoyl transferase component Bud32
VSLASSFDPSGSDVRLRDLVPGQVFAGRLKVTDRLGQGASGEVFRARDPQLRREVAIKVLLTSVEGPLRARFLREAQLTASLSHPNVVAVHWGGVTTEGRPYLVLELVEGARDLEAACESLLPIERVELLQTVVGAVAYLHAQGVVHRDLKPDNVLVDRHGQPHVCDMGLARHREEQERLTQTGAMLGTPLFMAPEQFSAREDHTVDPRLDVWALGVLLYQALTDRHPFDGDGMSLPELMARVRAGPPPSPRSLTREVSPAMSAVCLRALSVDPAQRYPDAGAMAEALDEALLDPGRRLPAGRVLAGAAAALVVLLAIAALAGGWLRPAGEDDEPVQVPGLVSDAAPAPEPEPKPEPEPEPEPEPTTADEYYERAERRILHERDLEGARSDLDRALELRPDFVLALTERAGVRVVQGDPRGAEADFGRAIELEPRNANALAGRGALRTTGGNPETGIMDLTLALEIDPANVRALNNRALARRDMGDVQGALRDLNLAIELDPSALTLNARGFILQALGDSERALQDFNEALALRPDYALAYNNRGGLKMARDDLEGALADFRRAVESNPEDHMGYANCGAALATMGEFSEALEYLDRAVELRPDAPLGLRNRGYTREHVGDPRGALADYQACLLVTRDPREASQLREQIARLERELR